MCTPREFCCRVSKTWVRERRFKNVPITSHMRIAYLFIINIPVLPLVVVRASTSLVTEAPLRQRSIEIFFFVCVGGGGGGGG